MKKYIPLALALALVSLTSTALAQPSVQFEDLGGGLVYPVAITHSGDGTGRLFILELEGRIRIFQDGQLQQEPFLDISSRVFRDGEAGLVGLAFHPRFKENRRFFVYYVTGEAGALRSVVSEFHASSSDPNLADPEEKTVLEFDRPTPIHLGGDLAFGPDGYLYIATGDGGDPDQQELAQRKDLLLGKILRLDVDGGDPYRSPADNPFVGDPQYRPETWALGFRNPWRFSFDRRTGELFAGDVGSNRAEEVNIVKPGRNYGWPMAEGFECRPGRMCDLQRLEPPIYAFGRSADGAAVIGGTVYRGSAAALFGAYVAADFVSRRVYALQDGPQGWTATEIARPNFRLSAFGEDETGEIYALDLVGGRVHRMFARYQYGFAQVGAGRYPGGEFSTELVLTNPWDEPVDLWFQFLSPQGEPLSFRIEDREASVFHQTLEPRSTRTLRPQSGNEIQAGWLNMLADREVGRTARLMWRDDAGRQLASVTVGPSLKACKYVVEAHRDDDAGISAGVAIANPFDGDPIHVSLELVDEQGAVVANQDLQLGPLQQRAEILESIGSLPENFSGSLRIRSDRPLLIMTLGTRGGLAVEAVRGGGFCTTP